MILKNYRDIALLMRSGSTSVVENLSNLVVRSSSQLHLSRLFELVLRKDRLASAPLWLMGIMVRFGADRRHFGCPGGCVPRRRIGVGLRMLDLQIA
jgi:hypothetical protein